MAVQVDTLGRARVFGNSHSIAPASAAMAAAAMKVADGAAAVPQQPGAEACEQGRDAAGEEEGAEAGRALRARGAASAIIRAKMPWVSAMCAPHRTTPKPTSPQARRLRQPQVGGDQQGDPAEQQAARGHAVAERAGGVGEQP